MNDYLLFFTLSGGTMGFAKFKELYPYTHRRFPVKYTFFGRLGINICIVLVIAATAPLLNLAISTVLSWSAVFLVVVNFCTFDYEGKSAITWTAFDSAVLFGLLLFSI